MKLSGLTFTYPKKTRKIFDDFTYEIEQGSVNILLGKNGAGKTTLFDIITKSLPAKYETDSLLQKTDIIYQLQGVPILKTLKGKHIAELILHSDKQLAGTEITPERIVSQSDRPIDAEKLQDLWESEYGKMSTGERRWLMIVLYCLLERKLYIFDEPTAGLDPATAKEVTLMIEQLSTAKKKTVLMTTHQLNELDYLTDFQFSLLEKGKITVTGQKEELERVLSEAS